MLDEAPPVGRLIRSWREQRRVSQLKLAVEARVSQKHLSFIESGRASPSRVMVMHLARFLDIPPREQNALLLAAGFAPAFRDRPLDDPALAPALRSIERLLELHEPFPALALDRGWNVVLMNAAVPRLLNGVDPDLLRAPQNVIRLSLHPRGLAPLIVNFDEWREHLIERLRRQLRISGDRAIASLLAEAEAYPAHPSGFRPASAKCGPEAGGAKRAGGESRKAPARPEDVAVLLRLRSPFGILSFLSTVTIFGTAFEVTLAELAIESFYPADEETARAARALASA